MAEIYRTCKGRVYLEKLKREGLAGEEEIFFVDCGGNSPGEEGNILFFPKSEISEDAAIRQLREIKISFCHAFLCRITKEDKGIKIEKVKINKESHEKAVV